jgi:hypothetical protein
MFKSSIINRKSIRITGRLKETGIAVTDEVSRWKRLILSIKKQIVDEINP